MIKTILHLAISLIIISCSSHTNNKIYNDDLVLLSLNTKIYELTSSNKESRICISPEYQGRVLTSTSEGLNGESLGWINRNNLQANYKGNGSDLGGEDRLWIGPLGGQYSFYYQQIKPLSEDNWKVPPSMNAEPYHVLSHTNESIAMKKSMKLTNYLGTSLTFDISRNIILLEKKQIEKNLQIKLPSEIKYVAYESAHKLTNIDSVRWNKKSGLASIWSLGMFQGEDSCYTLIPLKNSPTAKINTYMGQLDSTRLVKKERLLMYKTDGKWRSKIGIPKIYAPQVFACIKPQSGTLTVIQFQHTNDSLYFNSNPTEQLNPYIGEVIQVYNNGNMDYSSSNQNSFFELESTSAMKELAPGESIKHYHRVYHFKASSELLKSICKSLQIQY